MSRVPRETEDSMARELRACKVCGANFSATEENEFCPVCMLRRALAGGVESSESFLRMRPIQSEGCSATLGTLRTGDGQRWPTGGIGSRCDGRHLQGV